MASFKLFLLCFVLLESCTGHPWNNISGKAAACSDKKPFPCYDEDNSLKCCESEDDCQSNGHCGKNICPANKPYECKDAYGQTEDCCEKKEQCDDEEGSCQYLECSDPKELLCRSKNGIKYDCCNSNLQDCSSHTGCECKVEACKQSIEIDEVTKCAEFCCSDASFCNQINTLAQLQELGCTHPKYRHSTVETS